MIYYISDLHLGHANCIKLCNRPFSSVDEMDQTLISNWNQRVTNSDHIYIMGDLMFRVEKDPCIYLRQLRGKKHLIIGYHDHTWMSKCEYTRFFESVSYMDVIATNAGKCTLCHYPLMTHSGRYQIYGHIHNDHPASIWPLLAAMDNALNAGVDVNGFRPATLEELIENNKYFRAIPDFEERL